MKEDFKFRPVGTSLLLSFAELDAAMQGKFSEEIVIIDTRLCEIFDQYLTSRHSKHSNLGMMPAKDIIAKFR